MSKDKAPTAIHIAYEDEAQFDVVAPEKGLLNAIIQSALLDLNRKGAERRRAIEYFLDTDEEYIFSFRSICDYLSVDANKILMVTGIKPRKSAPQDISLESLTLEQQGRKH
jgi:hypothetical protein